MISQLYSYMRYHFLYKTLIFFYQEIRLPEHPEEKEKGAFPASPIFANSFRSPVAIRHLHLF